MAGCLSLVGCVDANAPNNAQVPSDSPARESRGACEALLPLATVEERIDNFEFLGDAVSASKHYQQLIAILDEPSRIAFLAGEDPLFCAWGAPYSDNVAYVFGARLTKGETDDLIEGLRRSQYQQVDSRGELAFRSRPLEQSGTLSGFEHRIQGDSWLLLTGPNALFKDFQFKLP